MHVAAHLEKPILVEGSAGVGKTELALSVARYLGLPLVRLQCYEGLDESKALYEWKYGKQLLYTQILKDRMSDVLRDAEGFDGAMARLHEFGDLFFSEEFLEPRPLLRALREVGGAVLLIDEVDKSDEEFEAFLLEVLSAHQVTIPELGTVRADMPPVTFLTSNNTRDLGDALKRRCLHLHIPLPDARLERRIVADPGAGRGRGAPRRQLVDFVQQLRTLELRKLPSISETIDWARALVLLNAHELERELVRDTLNVLLKFEVDVERADRELPALLAHARREGGGDGGTARGVGAGHEGGPPRPAPPRALAFPAAPGQPRSRCSKVLERFLKALRGMDVPVSVAESIDAHRAAALVGWSDRTLLRDALAVAVAKSEDEKERYFECFDAFFAAGGECGTGRDGRGEGARRGRRAPARDAAPDPDRPAGELARMLLDGDRAGVAAAMAAAAGAVDLSRLRLFTQRGVFMRRILDEMGIGDLEAEIRDLRADARTTGRGPSARAGSSSARERLVEEARDLVERNIALFADPASARLREEFLERMRLAGIPPRDFDRVRRIVRQDGEAPREPPRAAPLQPQGRPARPAAHDSLEHRPRRGPVPARVAVHPGRAPEGGRGMRRERLGRRGRAVPAPPPLLAARGHVGPSRVRLLEPPRGRGRPPGGATRSRRRRPESWSGSGSGRPTTDAPSATSRRATSGRSSTGKTTLHRPRRRPQQPGRPARRRLARDRLFQRAKRVIWLNPEPRPFWGTGDSEMLRYLPYCHVVRVCNTLRHLERAVDDLLAARA